MISGHPIFTSFRRLTGCQRDPRDRGVIRALAYIGLLFYIHACTPIKFLAPLPRIGAFTNIDLK